MFYRGAPQALEEAARAEANAIKSLGKAAIIELANQRLKCTHPELHISPSDYHISVQANAVEVQVKYRRYVRYRPARLKDENPHYDVSVDLVAANIDPFDSVFFRENFFVETQQDKENIRFATANILPQLGDYTLHIIEHEAYFSVIDENLNGYGFFEWERVKLTGERIDKPTLSATPAEPLYSEPNPLDTYSWRPIHE